MAADIVPELFKTIQDEFTKRTTESAKYRRFVWDIMDKKASLDDVHDISVFLGETLSDVLRDTMTADILPDGKLYWNIADRIIKPMLEGNYSTVNQMAAEIQKIVDEANGIGIGAVQADFPEKRAADLIDKAVDAGDEYEKWLGEPIVNITESFADDYMKKNAEFRNKAGLKVSIIRKAEGTVRKISRGRKYTIPCAWCDSLAGVYDYANVPAEVYQRHEYCRCSVTYKNGRTRQNVWTKDIWHDGISPQERIEKARGILNGQTK